MGDLKGNAEKIISHIERAERLGAELILFPELAITGYPPKDLLLKPSFVRKNLKKLKEIAMRVSKSFVVLGFVDEVEKNIFNGAALLHQKKLIGVQHKIHLPNYDVFDEKRYFEKAQDSKIFKIKKTKVGISICEDIWKENPTKHQAEKGAELILNISASPFYAGKLQERIALLKERARENRVFIAYVNLVGGQDHLVFDGGSCLFNDEGRLIALSKRFEEDLLITELRAPNTEFEKKDSREEILQALVLGIKDYVRKNEFEKIVIGLSGGIDSSLTAVLATKALGPKNVLGILMPSEITPKQSIEDAKKLALNLQIKYKVIPISKIFDSYLETLHEEFRKTKNDVTEENIQARIRGNLLMAISNKFGYLVLNTGNKSELAMGYVTLYGDLAGGLSVLSDVPKTLVYRLANFINMRREIIPKNIIKKEPSAELREGQKDTDSLPPYEILDPILNLYIERDESKEEIVSKGFLEKLVSEIICKVDHNEYKRCQAPPGIKITPRAFGFGRRMPITNKFRD
ncbi:MAG: NAD+ synthase [Candidatus Methanofastidiosia archaeon]